MTCNDLKDTIFALIDEIGKNGLTTGDTAQIALRQIPIFANLCQRELAKYSRYRKYHEFTHTDDNSGDLVAFYALPVDLEKIRSLYIVKDGAYYKTPFNLENNMLIVPNNIETTYRIVYTPKFSITAMTDTIYLDGDIEFNIFVHYIAGNILLNGDRQLSNYYLQLYNEMKLDYIRKNDTLIEEQVVDVNGSC